MLNTGTLKVSTPTADTIALTRVFDAPKALVFRALTEPDLVKRWYGPRGHQLTTCEIDFRVGGKWRYIIRSPDGGDMGMSGVYREIDAPHGMVSTEAFDDFPGESVVTLVLTEEGGKTTMVSTVRYPSPEVRDIVIGTGMEHGAAESFDRLAEVLDADAARA